MLRVQTCVVCFLTTDVHCSLFICFTSINHLVVIDCLRNKMFTAWWHVWCPKSLKHFSNGCLRQIVSTWELQQQHCFNCIDELETTDSERTGCWKASICCNDDFCLTMQIGESMSQIQLDVWVWVHGLSRRDPCTVCQHQHAQLANTISSITVNVDLKTPWREEILVPCADLCWDFLTTSLRAHHSLQIDLFVGDMDGNLAASCQSCVTTLKKWDPSALTHFVESFWPLRSGVGIMVAWRTGIILSVVDWFIGRWHGWESHCFLPMVHHHCFQVKGCWARKEHVVAVPASQISCANRAWHCDVGVACLLKTRGPQELTYQPSEQTSPCSPFWCTVGNGQSTHTILTWIFNVTSLGMWFHCHLWFNGSSIRRASPHFANCKTSHKCITGNVLICIH